MLLCAQGLVFAIHNDVVLARDDTRQLARDWMVEQRPAGTKVVIEPVMPDSWASDPGRALRGTTGNGARWAKWPTSRSRINPDGTLRKGGLGPIVKLEDYERTLFPQLVRAVRRARLLHGADRLDAVRPRARRAGGRPAGDAYYDELQRSGRVVFAERQPVRTFSFDFSFNCYPLSFDRPGPEIVIYRLHGRGRAVGAVKYPPRHVTTLLQTDHAPLARAIELAEQGRGRDQPQPAGGRRGGPRGPDAGGGLARRLRRPARRARGARGLRRHRRGRRDALRLARAVLPPGPDPAVHRRDPRGAKLARVVVASDDPTEKASGRGLGILRDEGIEVVVADGELAARARCLNQAFRKHARTGRPQVLFKSAMTLDGKVATRTGDSKWISGEDARYRAHHWRAERDAVVVGIGTALADDPQLTARVDGDFRQPARVVFDSEARLPLDSQLVRGRATRCR